ncbi:hypothetical protein PIROE2DRAFT_6878 [Piromyces sp. E2]|nr:hypothetical protein PIROE2DRAFT_6878 [Piromyces sp. E2]|eukprot:OUM65986.1 hypothetical protein PIROE2DRAFT_6878 [Piromyces sp. E2]
MNHSINGRLNAKAKADAYQKYKAGMKSGIGFSGRELFDFNPELAKPYDDDDDAMDEYVREESDDNTENANEGNTEDKSKDKGKEKLDVSDMKESISNVEDEIKVNEELFADEDLEGLDDIDDDDEE